jgi:hypothetical protein
VAFREGRCFQVFIFSEKEHAEIFRAGVRRRAMYPSEKGKGARWAQWKKETNEQMPKRQP